MVLPGYDGRRRTFFMYGFEGIHEARPRNNGTPTVPTEKMRNGDFSELLALGRSTRSTTRLRAALLPDGRIQADPFPGNIIPASLINPVARQALDYIGTAAHRRQRRRHRATSRTRRCPKTIKYATNTIRVDHNRRRSKQRLYGRFSWYDRNSNYNNYFNNLSTGEWFKFISRQAALDHVYVFNASTVLNLRYGYNCFVRGTDTNPANHGFDLTSLGFPASYNSADPGRHPPVPALRHHRLSGHRLRRRVSAERRPNSFLATLNKSMGAHSLRTGSSSGGIAETSDFFANNQTGQFNFDATWTRGPLDNSPTAPDRSASRSPPSCSGCPTSGSVARRRELRRSVVHVGPLSCRTTGRSTSRLTLNLGLRYEYETPLAEADNRSVRGFDDAAASRSRRRRAPRSTRRRPACRSTSSTSAAA